MKKTKEPKKLKLHKETISNLQNSDLTRIAGGWGNTTVSGPLSECGPSACECHPE